MRLSLSIIYTQLFSQLRIFTEEKLHVSKDLFKHLFSSCLAMLSIANLLRFTTAALQLLEKARKP
jgi:hypothetical protein